MHLRATAEHQLQAMHGPGLTTRAMSRFRCAAHRCEDTCCAGWRVDLRRDDVVRLQTLSDNHATRHGDDQGELASGWFDELIQTSTTPDTRSAGSIRRDDTGRCRMLDQPGLCRLQRAYGEEALPAVCALYPRVVRQVGERLEASGLVSCPEYARELLLQPDGAEIEALADGVLTRDLALPEPEYGTPYAGHVDDVRSVIQTLLGRTQYPVRTRLFWWAFFAQRTRAFFHRGAADTEIAEPLARAMYPFTRPEELDAIAQRFDGQSLPPHVGVTFIQRLLALIGEKQTTVRLGRLLGEVQRTYALMNPAASLSAEAGLGIWPLYVARREAIVAVAGDRIDHAVINRARDYLFGTPHTGFADLQAHLQRLLVELAVVRFLLFSQPALDPLVVAGRSGSTDLDADALVDHCVVEVFSATARGIEHDRRIREGLGSLLSEVGLDGLAGSAVLLGV